MVVVAYEQPRKPRTVEPWARINSRLCIPINKRQRRRREVLAAFPACHEIEASTS